MKLISRTPDGNYSFDKSVFSSKEIIETLYKQKMEIPNSSQGKDLTNDLRNAYVTGDEFGAHLNLKRVMELDPRYQNIYFKDENSAINALEFALKFEKMTLKEFLLSGLPYLYISEVGINNIVVKDQAITGRRQLQVKTLFSRIAEYFLVAIIVIVIILYLINRATYEIENIGSIFSGRCFLGIICTSK